MKFNKPVQFLSAGVALSVVGLGLALISSVLLAEGYAARSWPTTEAQIVRAEVVVTQKAAGVRRRGAVFADFHQAKIEYQYSVNGKDFVGDKLAIGYEPEGFDPSIAQAAVAKYHLGNKVTISYNPARPESAVIDPTVNVALWWAGVVFGLVALVAGAVLWIKAIQIDEAQRPAAVVGAAPRPAKARLQGVVGASISGSAQTTVQVPMHWLLRTISVTTGLVFLLFGSLALVVSVQMGAPAANPAVPAGVAVAAQVITVAIMGCIVLFGAFLVRLGMKRSTRRIALGSAASANILEQSIDRPTPRSVTDFGNFIAQCGPQEDGQTHYLVAGAAMLVVGVLAFIAPLTFLVPKPGDEVAVKGFMWFFGGLSALGGLGLLWKQLFGQNQVILLYERGLVESVGSTSYAVALDEIEQLRVQEWYDHRFAPLTFNVHAKVRGEREFRFSSTLRGESKRIIAYLTEHVPQTELVPFQA